jgi:hypothetical protein
MGSYRRRLYQFAGKRDTDDNREDIVVPEYRNVSDTTYETMKPLMLHQEAANYLSNKDVEGIKDRDYAYSRPVLNGFMALRPTPEREEAAREQAVEQAIDANYARYLSSLPSYMITDRPGLDRPPIGLFDILAFGGKSLLEKGTKSLYNFAKKNIGQTSGNPAITGLPRYPYNIVKYDKNLYIEPKVLYEHPLNRLQIDTRVFKKVKFDKGSGDIKSVDKYTDNKMNKLIAGINKEDKRAIEWNSSPYRIWGNESDRIRYLQNLENIKNNRKIGIVDLNKYGYAGSQGFFDAENQKIFLMPLRNKSMLNNYYHEFTGHAGDIGMNSMGLRYNMKSKLLGNAWVNYFNTPKFAAEETKEGLMPIMLRGKEDKLLKKYAESYDNRTLKNLKIRDKIEDLVEYKTHPEEIVARVEELRWDLLTNKVKFNGKPFSPSTVIGDKEFAILNRPFSAGFFDTRSLLKKYDLDMFTPKTLMDLMNKLPFAAGIGTAGLAGYGLSED